MASPAAGYGDDSSDTSKKILFRFCSECSNLLFPREDKANNRLLFACRTCSFTEDAPSSCVMRHEIASSVGDTAGVTHEVGQDPTVGPSCSDSHANPSEAFPWLCTMCGQDIVCEECGENMAPGLVLEADEDNASPADDSQEESEEEVDKHSSKN